VAPPPLFLVNRKGRGKKKTKNPLSSYEKSPPSLSLRRKKRGREKRRKRGIELTVDVPISSQVFLVLSRINFARADFKNQEEKRKRGKGVLALPPLSPRE